MPREHDGSEENCEMELLNYSAQCVRSRCDWDTYERLLRDNSDSSSPRFTYDQGWLEIMSPSVGHEQIVAALKLLIQALADHAGIDWQDTGSTTFRREDLQRGFEPDASFYFREAATVRPLKHLDLSRHPAPELIVEVEVFNSDLDKLSLYHSLGVDEVWRWSKNNLIVLQRQEVAYQSSSCSRIFPQAEAEQLGRLVLRSAELTKIEWNRVLRAWLNEPDERAE